MYRVSPASRKNGAHPFTPYSSGSYRRQRACRYLQENRKSSIIPFSNYPRYLKDYDLYLESRVIPIKNGITPQFQEYRIDTFFCNVKNKFTTVVWGKNGSRLIQEYEYTLPIPWGNNAPLNNRLMDILTMVHLDIEERVTEGRPGISIKLDNFIKDRKFLGLSESSFREIVYQKDLNDGLIFTSEGPLEFWVRFDPNRFTAPAN